MNKHVLLQQTMDTEPRVSMAASERIMAFSRAIFRTACATATITMLGGPSTNSCHTINQVLVIEQSGKQLAWHDCHSQRDRDKEGVVG